MHFKKIGYPIAEKFESVGWYSDIYDLIDNSIIAGIPFCKNMCYKRLSILTIAKADFVVISYSLLKRRNKFNQANVLSTFQRFGMMYNRQTRKQRNMR